MAGGDARLRLNSCCRSLDLEVDFSENSGWVDPP